MVVSYVDATAGAVEHCEVMATEFPDLAPRYQAIGQSCQQKLWHQLTLQVLDFVQDPNAARTCLNHGGVHTYLAVYDKVILAVESKLNPLSLAVIASHVSNALAAENDMTAAKAVLENLLSKQNNQQKIYLESKHALLVLKQPPSDPQELAGLAKMIKTNADKLAKADYYDHRVHAAHYETCLQYYKLVGPPEAFYTNALQFLQYAPPPPQSQQITAATTFWQDLGVDLCLAALTGEGVYNNLAQVQTICADLIPEIHPQRWLVDLLNATADGNVTHFQQLSHQYEEQIRAQPALVALQDKVKEKLTLLALVHLVFDKSSHERDISFSEIAERLQIPVDQVEWVVMRACSVGILQGQIDQVAQQVHVSWILPRVLNADQMRALAVRYGDWANQVSKTKEYMQENQTTAA